MRQQPSGGFFMIRKLSSIALAGMVVTAAFVSTAQDAEARRGRGVGVGVAAGIIGLGILGAAAAANAGPRYYGGPAYYRGGGCYPGPRQCYRQGGACWYNRFGDYVCSQGRLVCNRPMICP